MTHIQLVGCPDPNPTYERFVEPAAATLPADLDVIGERYVGAMRHEVGIWLRAIPASEPIGVLFSGGVDSGAVLLTVYKLLLEMGQSPARLKAFTLSVDGRRGRCAAGKGVPCVDWIWRCWAKPWRLPPIGWIPRQPWM